MKLISCYIENFGCLSQYKLDLRPGLTLIEEENGFGKTTLAEFIRAMFYGFPRAVKRLEKNYRKKYMPWQGGKYGGWLVFEHNGRQYRIDRTFGEIPKSDTFSLTDPVTRQKLTDFSENIGVELFQLDADSFERSTYMPQSHDSTALTTTGIQAKLGNLVEDTNDINNFDKAMAALKAKRTSYIPYKGSGGSVAEANAKISALQLQLENARCRVPDLEKVRRNLEDTRQANSSANADREAIRARLTQVSQQAARSSLAQQQRMMEQRCRQNEADLETLTRQYPAGLPTLAELDQLEPDLLRLATLKQTPETTPAEAEALELIARETRFSQRTPTPADFAEIRQQSLLYTQTQSALDNLKLSDYEADQLSRLQALFAPGLPDEDFLESCHTQSLQRSALLERRKAPDTEEAERLQLENLKIFFANGLPEEGEIAENQQRLAHAAALRQENVAITAAQEAAARDYTPPEPPPKKPVVPMSLGGAVLALAGIILLLLQLVLPGVAALVCGAVVLALAFTMKLKQDVALELYRSRQNLPVMSESDRQRLRSNTRAAEALEREVLSFTAVYISDSRPPADKLSQISTKRDAFLQLSEKQQAAARQSQVLDNRIQALTEELTQALSPYFGTLTRFEDHILSLKTDLATYRQLTEKTGALAQKSAELKQTLSGLEQTISAFLSAWQAEASPDSFDTAIAKLEREHDAYTDAQRLLERRKQRLATGKAEAENCRGRIRAVTERYELQSDLTQRSAFHQLRDDVHQLNRLTRQAKTDAQALADFCREHEAALRLPLQEELPDPEALKLSEKQLSDQLGLYAEQIVDLEQQQRLLLATVDTIPGLEDELEQWQQKKEADIASGNLLDQTMAYLVQARESLCGSYLGTVKQNFCRYMDRVTQSGQEGIFVNADLEVTLERQGQPRSLASFSAGQTDIVMLCMRLALVDALFEEVKPFVILDDPFVNLDDRHTAQALALLQELSRDHQIIYLTCNSSRSLKR